MDEEGPASPEFLGTLEPLEWIAIEQRVAPKDAPNVNNFNFYYIAEGRDGRLYQSPPQRTTDPAHHSPVAPDWSAIPIVPST